MATAENVYPKVGNDPFFASEAMAMRGFGDGTDGDFSESSGTINLTQGTIFQYSSFTLGVNATLSASSTSDKPIIIFVQCNCVINGTIDLQGKGQPGGIVYYLNTGALNDNLASPGLPEISGSNVGGSKGGVIFNFESGHKIGIIMNGTGGGAGDNGPTNGDGGGGGASASNNGVEGVNGGTGGSGAAGAAGTGGCTILMIIGGTLTFGASSTVNTSGGDGGDGSGGAASGGGGGGSGDIMIFHKGSKTDNGVTTDVTGGTGGTAPGGNGGAGGNGRVTIASFDTLLMMV